MRKPDCDGGRFEWFFKQRGTRRKVAEHLDIVARCIENGNCGTVLDTEFLGRGAGGVAFHHLPRNYRRARFSSHGGPDGGFQLCEIGVGRVRQKPANRCDLVFSAADENDRDRAGGFLTTKVDGDFASMRWKAREINDKCLGLRFANAAAKSRFDLFVVGDLMPCRAEKFKVTGGLRFVPVDQANVCHWEIIKLWLF